jgi:hypothetical protein
MLSTDVKRGPQKISAAITLEKRRLSGLLNGGERVAGTSLFDISFSLSINEDQLLMPLPEDHAPRPKGSRKFIIIAAAVVVTMIVIVFVGLNAQHAKDLQDKKAGIVNPQNAPITEKDLGKQPIPK